MKIPKALKGLNFVEPPRELVDFSKNYGVENVVLVDDDSCRMSMRYSRDIFVRISGSWPQYTLFPISAKTFSEMVFLRFLHEVGHVHFRHCGSLRDEKNVKIKKTGDFWEDVFGGNEGEAWFFAFWIRKTRPDQYLSLIEVLDDFFQSYKYKGKVYWENSCAKEWQRIYGDMKPIKPPNWLLKKYSMI
jgi:hypothetical protein